MRATPVRSGMSTGSGWLTPSGKMRIAPPCLSAAATARNMAAFCAGSLPGSRRRWTGSAPASRRNGARSGWRKSGALATGRRMRGKVAMRISGSTSAFR